MIELKSLEVGFLLAMIIVYVFYIIYNYEESSFWQRTFAFIILIFQTWGFFLNLAQYIKLI